MIFGVSMVRDEADIIGETVANLIAQGIERFLVLDNNSTDDTAAILARFPQVEVIPDPEVGYYQAAKITALARQALDAGATWIVPFDADEHWYSSTGTLAETFAAQPERVGVLTATTWSQWGPYREIVPHPFPKVAFRAHPHALMAQGAHDVGHPLARVDGLLCIRERQYRTFAQFVRKVRNGKEAYDASDLPEWEGAHWRHLGALSDTELVGAWEQLRSAAKVLDPVSSSPTTATRT